MTSKYCTSDKTFDYRDNSLCVMTSTFIGTSDKNARNGSRKQAEKPQDKDETMTSQIERMTSQIVSNTFVTMAAANIMA